MQNSKHYACVFIKIESVAYTLSTAYTHGMVNAVERNRITLDELEQISVRVHKASTASETVLRYRAVLQNSADKAAYREVSIVYGNLNTKADKSIKGLIKGSLS